MSEEEFVSFDSSSDRFSHMPRQTQLSHPIARFNPGRPAFYVLFDDVAMKDT
jgi:hypothetical protein